MKVTDIVDAVCPHCSKTFKRRLHDLNRGLGVTCSVSCGQRLRRAKQPRAEAFWKKVRLVSPGECWEWTGYVNKHGYGVTSWDQKSMLSHRKAYKLTTGALPDDGKVLCHTCDNPPCCNPAHLFVGTGSENMQDSIAKGRFRRACGDANGKTKLLTPAVLDVRARFSRGETQTEISRELNINRSTVRNIVHRRTWKYA
jgi:hypothetical protein